MRLVHCLDRPDRFQLHIDLGPIPGAHNGEIAPYIHKALLISNHRDAGQTGLTWGINPQNGHVTLICEKSFVACEGQSRSYVDADSLYKLIEDQWRSVQSFWFDLMSVFNPARYAQQPSGFADQARPERQAYGKPSPLEIH